MKFDMIFLTGFYAGALCTAVESPRVAVVLAFVATIIAGAIEDF